MVHGPQHLKHVLSSPFQKVCWALLQTVKYLKDRDNPLCPQDVVFAAQHLAPSFRSTAPSPWVQATGWSPHLCNGVNTPVPLGSAAGLGNLTQMAQSKSWDFQGITLFSPGREPEESRTEIAALLPLLSESLSTEWANTRGGGKGRAGADCIIWAWIMQSLKPTHPWTQTFLLKFV